MMTVAFWCVLVAVLLPYVCFGVAARTARRAGQPRDNRNPRDFPNLIGGGAKRAWGAHLNSLEALPGFAAAVIIAHLAHALQLRADALAVIWVLARIAFISFYIADRSTLRSVMQGVSLTCVLGLFVVAALGPGGP